MPQLPGPRSPDQGHQGRSPADGTFLGRGSTGEKRQVCSGCALGQLLSLAPAPMSYLRCIQQHKC